MVFALVLLGILVISFRSRSVDVRQHLGAMSGIKLETPNVLRTLKQAGPEGVTSLFLDLLIRKDLEERPLQIPDDAEHDAAHYPAWPSPSR